MSFSGGLIGLLFGSHKGKLESQIAKLNNEGWNLVEVIPDQLNLVLVLLRLVLLVVTLGLWTLGTSFLLVFERPRDADERFDKPAQTGPALRAEPRLR